MLGMFSIVYYTNAEIPILFLTVDRILGLRFPLRYRDRKRRVLCVLGAIATLLGYSYIVLLYYMNLPLDLKKGGEKTLTRK